MNEISKKDRISHLISLMGSGNLWVDLGTGPAESTAFDDLYNLSDFNQVICIDINPEVKKRPALPNVTIFSEDLRTFDIPECSLVTGLHVIEHLEETFAKKLLKRLKRITSKVIIETPDQFEDGLSEVRRSNNPYQKHHFLADADFMSRLSFKRVAWYRQNSLFTNGIYLWQRK